jgi:hypothetical protein
MIPTDVPNSVVKGISEGGGVEGMTDEVVVKSNQVMAYSSLRRSFSKGNNFE